MRKTFPPLLLALIAGLMMTACTTPMKVTASWMNPEVKAKEGKKFQKVFLLALTSNMSARQTVETDQAKACAAEGIVTVKSSDVFTPGFLKSDPGKDAILQKIKESGCDAIFTSALVDTKTETRYVPGTTTMYAPYPAYGYYGSFGGYYGYSSTYMYDPGYYVNDKTYYIESNLYDLATGEIVWSVQSEAYDASDLNSLSKEYAALLINKLKQEGVLNKKK
ncbi:MAG TPA: hypothetical protein PK228_17270 [Saprospiraceae bacterium]|nr:hypothetical protein [Saprospiraceae bacterium]